MSSNKDAEKTECDIFPGAVLFFFQRLLGFSQINYWLMKEKVEELKRDETGERELQQLSFSDDGFSQLRFDDDGSALTPLGTQLDSERVIVRLINLPPWQLTL